MLDRLKKLLRPSASESRKTPMSKIRVFNPARNAVIATAVEVAATGAQRSKGLLGRRSLGVGEGLWIVPCESVHTFAMQFAIDLIYLDRQHRIRKIRKNVRPWRVSACITAHSVIELAAGTIRDQDAQIGDVIELGQITDE